MVRDPLGAHLSGISWGGHRKGSSNRRQGIGKAPAFKVIIRGTIRHCDELRGIYMNNGCNGY